MTTFEKALTSKIEERAADIKDFLAMGWTLEDAIAEVKRSSTLGAKPWERIMEIVGAGR